MLKEILILLQSQMNMVNSSLKLNWLDLTEIAIIVAILYAVYRKFIKNTQAEKLVKGILFLVLAWAFSELLIRIDLTILGMFVRAMVSVISLSLIVIFQPELRRFLGYLGQGGFFNEIISNNHNKVAVEVDILKEIIESVKYLSKNKVGALIVFQNSIDATSYFDIGTKIDADISTELILTIFHPNTPLHDGAMIIKDFKIHSAGVLLPLTEDPKLSWRYGTRHRAAIGVTEISDSACLVVSEETGNVSVAMDGTLKKYEDLATLKVDLENILGLRSENENVNQKTIFKIDNLITIKKKEHENK